MRLLVSVRSAPEARIAIASGASVVDVKEPTRGALGPADDNVVREVRSAIGDSRALSVVIGDVRARAVAFTRAQSAVIAGGSIVKVGMAGVIASRRAVAIARAAVDGADGAPVAVVAYADCDAARALDMSALLDVALETGCAGFVVDTYDKRRGTLFDYPSRGELATVIGQAKAGGLFTGVAGSLGLRDVEQARATGADLLGARRALCDGSREGALSGERVRDLAAACIVPLARPA